MALDSFILKRSGLARVTVVARSNYDIVNGDLSSLKLQGLLTLNLLFHTCRTRCRYQEPKVWEYLWVET